MDKSLPVFSLKSSTRTALAFTLVALILLGNAWFLSLIAFRGFNLLDFSSFIDASWRVYRGQRPYIDFFYHTGPLHLQMNALFFKIFGFGKTAILAHLVTLSSVVILLTFLVTWKKIPLLFSILATTLSATGFYWSWPHPFYDFTSHFWGLTAVALVYWQLPFRSKKSAFFTAFCVACLVALCCLTKTNTGGAYGLLFLVIFLLSPLRLNAFLGYLAGGAFFAVISVLFIVPDLAAFYESAFTSYAYWRTNQFYRFIVPMVWFKNFYWLPAIIIPLVVLAGRFQARGKLALFLGLGLVGLFALNTGSRREWDHLPVMGMYLGLGYCLLFDARGHFTRRWQRILFWLCLITLVWVNLIQIRRSYDGGMRHYNMTSRHYPHGRYPLKSKPFDGWLFMRSDGESIDYLVDYIKKNVPRKDSLLILSNLQVLNALTDRDGYLETPFIWQVDNFPLPGTPIMKKIRDHILQNPPDWIVITLGEGAYESLGVHNLLKYMDLLELEDHYKIVGGLGAHGILKRR